MNDTALRAARVMNSQAGMLRRRMEMSRPAAEEVGSMLFKRAVPVPANTSLEQLLQRYNPGVTTDTLTDMVSTACLWNRIPGPKAVREGQQLLIPTVIPHGQEPKPGMQVNANASLRPPMPAMRSPGMAMTSQLAEQRARTTTAAAAAAAGPGASAPQPASAPASIWATSNQAGQNLAGSQVKQQFQANIWSRRG